MKRPSRIALAIILAAVLVAIYFFVIQRPGRVEAPSGFRGPTSPPRVNGPPGPPPEQ